MRLLIVEDDRGARQQLLHRRGGAIINAGAPPINKPSREAAAALADEPEYSIGTEPHPAARTRAPGTMKFSAISLRRWSSLCSSAARNAWIAAPVAVSFHSQSPSCSARWFGRTRCRRFKRVSLEIVDRKTQHRGAEKPSCRLSGLAAKPFGDVMRRVRDHQIG